MAGVEIRLMPWAAPHWMKQLIQAVSCSEWLHLVPFWVQMQRSLLCTETPPTPQQQPWDSLMCSLFLIGKRHHLWAYQWRLGPYEHADMKSSEKPENLLNTRLGKGAYVCLCAYERTMGGCVYLLSCEFTGMWSCTREKLGGEKEHRPLFPPCPSGFWAYAGASCKGGCGCLRFSNEQAWALWTKLKAIHDLK